MHIVIKNLYENLFPSNYAVKTQKLSNMSMSLHTIPPHPTTSVQLGRSLGFLDFLVPPRQRDKYGVWDRERGLGWGFHFLALDTKSYRAPFPPGFRIKFDAYRRGVVGG